MNKREKEALCQKIAGWEWQQGGSSSSAATLGACNSELIELFGLTKSDLSFHRAWEIFQLTKADGEDDDYLDKLCDRVDDDYEAVVDLIESTGLAGFRAALTPEAPGAQEETL